MDEFPISVRIVHEELSKINLNRLEDIDLKAAVETFTPVHSMNQSGVFKPINPF